MKIDIKTTTTPDIVQITTLDERFYRRESDLKIIPSATWIASCYPKGVGFYRWLAEHGWDEAEAIKQEAGERGSKVHHGIESLLKGQTIRHDQAMLNVETNLEEEISVSEYECLVSFRDWFIETWPRIILTESLVFNDEENYAGTMDCKCEIDGEIWILDFKTSQNIWPSHELQLSAYRHAPENADVKRTAILQVGYRRNKRKYKFTEVEDKFDLFLAAKLIWQNEHGNEHPHQYELPTSLNLKG